MASASCANQFQHDMASEGERPQTSMMSIVRAHSRERERENIKYFWPFLHRAPWIFLCFHHFDCSLTFRKRGKPKQDWVQFNGKPHANQ